MIPPPPPDRNTGATAATPLRGGPRCVLCHHERRAEFDRALALGTLSGAAIAREIGTHRAAVSRHARGHLLPGVLAEIAADPELSNLDPLEELRQLFRRMKKHLAGAEQTGNLLAVKVIAGEVRAALELFGKFQALAEARRALAPAGEDPFRDMSLEALRSRERQLWEQTLELEPERACPCGRPGAMLPPEIPASIEPPPPPRLLPAPDAIDEEGSPEHAPASSSSPAATGEAPAAPEPVPVPKPVPGPPVFRGGFRHESDGLIQLPSGTWWRR